MHENEGFRHLPSEEYLIKVENLLGMKFREREMCLEGETVEINQERSWKVRSES